MADDELAMVWAVIRPERLSEVKASLAEREIQSLTVTNVSGRGSQPAKSGQWRGEEYVVDLHQKVKLECVVPATDTDRVIEAIRDGADTGERGDGKIFVVPIDEAVQIRTGDRGIDAI